MSDDLCSGGRGMNSHLLAAAKHHCEQQERWAHADFFFNMNPGSRKQLAQEGAHPWRGAMSPSLLALINVLEEMGEYGGTGLSVPANMS